MGPVLSAVKALGGSAQPREVYDWVKVANPELASHRHFEPGVRFARWYLEQDSYLASTARGVWTLTAKGTLAGEITPARARSIFDRVHPREARLPRPARRGPRAVVLRPPPPDPVRHFVDHRAEVLEHLRSLSPGGFERFCQRLLREAGFQSVEVRGRSGDGGIDGVGVLQVNRLVSFRVAFQCKRYRGSVQARELREFRGAVVAGGVKRIFLTTGNFTSGAITEGAREGAEPIDLIDGEQIVNMLEDFGIGLVQTKAFRVDAEFFSSFMEGAQRGRA